MDTFSLIFSIANFVILIVVLALTAYIGYRLIKFICKKEDKPHDETKTEPPKDDKSSD